MYAIGFFDVTTGTNRRLTSARLRDLAGAAGRYDLVASIDRLETDMIRYSNEDSDVLNRAWAELGWPRA